MNFLMDLLSKIGSCLILTSSAFYIWKELLNKKFDYKNYRLYITYISIVVISIVNYYYVSSFIRMVLLVIMFSYVIKVLFKTGIKTAIITSIYTELLVVFSETIFALVITEIFNMNSNTIVETQFGSFVANLMISIISLILIRFKFVKKLYEVINSIIDRLTEIHLIIMCLIVIIIVNILEATLYYDINYGYLLILNTLFMAFCFFVILYSFKNRNNYIKVYDKYNTTLNSLKEYETILDKYRISNHENKNQLLTIRNMLPKEDEKIISYIDVIVKNKLADDDRIMFETAKIPAGGLRGLIYSKILLMKNLKIDYELEISNEIKTVDLISKIDDSTMLDICKVIGVYLDNAIQAVKTLKEKYINIEMYMDDSFLVISIANNYKGKIDVDKLEQKGYTSKGRNHGYGLALSKEIIDNNKNLTNEKIINKETFSQVLKIKIKS